MGEILSVSNVNIAYDKNQVYKDLNLSIGSGKIVGLLGPNGSGKTTLIKMIAGLLKYKKGSIKVDGHEIGPESKALVAYLPDGSFLNEKLKVKSLIDIYSDFFKDFDKAKAVRIIGDLGIDLNSRFKALSKGNKEKVQLGLVMSRHAKIYLLDEPIGGVDPAARDYILSTIISNYDKDSTIIISTHLIQDIENVLDEVIFVKEGEILLQRNADDLRTERNQSIDDIFREEFRC